MSKEIIKHFNNLLTNELTSVRQYLLHFAILKDNGVNKLAERAKNEFTEELQHVNEIAERILLLSGVPNFQDTNEIFKYDGKFTKETVKNFFEANIELETKVIRDIKAAFSTAEQEKDYASIILLEKLLVSEEGHLHWIKEQLHLIELIGIENYLITQI